MPKKVGVEWVNNYRSPFPSLKNRGACAEGFYNKINATKSFNWGNDMAWDQDFEQSGVGSPATGSDTSWVDTVDLAFFAGHGHGGGMLFGVTDRDNGKTDFSEMKLGDGRCRYLVCDSCETLANPIPGWAVTWWRSVFNGLRAAYGFATVTYDNGDRGGIFADYLNEGYYIDSAWKMACQETESASVQWGYLCAFDNTQDAFWDRWSSAAPAISNPTGLTYRSGSC